MKASELRIGNLVIDGKEIITVNARVIKMLQDGEAEFDPIPLTKEWMLKFGFELIEEIQGLKHYWLDDTGLLSIRESKYNDHKYDLIVHAGINSSIYLMSFDFVHQLQNYFSLTEKELKLK